MAGKYLLVVNLMHLFAQESLFSQHRTFHSLLRLTNLIENPNMNTLRSDVQRSGMALKAYLCILMALPAKKYHQLLYQRLPPQVWTKVVPSPEAELHEIEFTNKVISSLKLTELSNSQ